jgi:hypothetical protein
VADAEAVYVTPRAKAVDGVKLATFDEASSDVVPVTGMPLEVLSLIARFVD